MQFHIEQLILWPSNPSNAVHSLTFEAGAVNIIHGRSRTGKSSIIAIIDYCLGASRCAIPVGIIRDSVSWFGLRVNVRGSSFIVARRTPGARQTSNEFYLAPFEDSLPEAPSYTHSDAKFKEQFNNLVRLTNLPLKDSEKGTQFDGRPSYRDLAAFNFLPQHIVANPNTLFFKTDSYEHKERLKKVFPFAFGIIDGTYLIKERERAQLQRQLDDLVKQQEVKKRAMASWEVEVERLWSQGVELGVFSREVDSATDVKIAALKELNSAFLNGNLLSVLGTPNYGFTNDKYRTFQDAEEAAQKEVESLRGQIRSLERLSKRGQQFTDAVSTERSRVINLDWLKSNLTDVATCVVCGGETRNHRIAVDHLQSEMLRIGGLSDALFENPIVDKEIHNANESLTEAQRRLQAARTGRLSLVAAENSTKDSLSKIYVLMGRIQAFLIGLASIHSTDELADQITGLSSKISVINTYLSSVDRDTREAVADRELTKLISKFSEDFGLERRGQVRLDKQELTLSFSLGDDFKKEYLWEVGSGENWMGYHIATFLAIHEYIAKPERANLPVFNFLVIDQPSQVYFPSAATGANQLDASAKKLAELRKSRDADFVATKRIFEIISMGLKAAGHRCQIIVLDHADQSIWGEVADTVEVANWKELNAGLIPSWWQ
ncbi:Complete genome; segment 15/17 [Cupriavidus taiwanensis]|uniref:Complete genome segment 15/17 n=1 Tax=Cupriavidus taiwanensis TaxID=164546 RepID=A0A375B8R8_9BURK|nr:DUF3732 domain-containing protein [Cupriavidus taiwanensis]SOY40000.1 Complete genome; segment 15/17 [Cupriavidus taiwanensis]